VIDCEGGARQSQHETVHDETRVDAGPEQRDPSRPCLPVEPGGNRGVGGFRECHLLAGGHAGHAGLDDRLELRGDIGEIRAGALDDGVRPALAQRPCCVVADDDAGGTLQPQHRTHVASRLGRVGVDRTSDLEAV
jgi:hypothetical protein